MAKKKKIKRAQRAKVIARNAAAPPIRPQAVPTKVSNMLDRQQRAIAAGKNKKAAKIGNRIVKQTMKSPQFGFSVEEGLRQDEFNQNIAANRPNQQTIGGGRNYTTDEQGNVTITDQLDPGQQRLYDESIANRSSANQAFQDVFNNYKANFAQPFNFNGLPQAPNTSDLAGERQRIEQGAYDRELRFINQDYDRSKQQLMDRMYQTGNPEGTPAYIEAMKRLDDQYHSLRDDARTKATTIGGQEFERSFNIGSQGRANALNESLIGRQVPMQELGQLASYGGGPTMMPNFVGFNPVAYQGPQYMPYLQTGIETELARQQLKQRGASGGGGSGGPPPFQVMPPSPIV